MDFIRVMWLTMFESPWKLAKGSLAPVGDWLVWLTWWAWTIAGLALGALVAPSLLKWAGLTNTSIAGWLEIAIAVVVGAFVQIVGTLLALLGLLLLAAILLLFIGVVALISRNRAGKLLDAMSENEIGLPGNIVVYALMVLSPIACVGYAVYRYLIGLDLDQRTTAITFAAALLVKTFLIPFIKGLVTGTLFRWFIRWLRGDKAKAKSA